MMLSVEEPAVEESPKRRSTFYVSLQENEPRSSRFQKSSDPSDKFSCNSFPITQSKTVPNVPLSVRANVDGSSSASKKLGEPGSLEPRGKVQSLTRIFETSKGSPSGGLNNNGGSSGNLNNSGSKAISGSNNNISKAAAAAAASEQRKKVERTRSFKTIERFQNRFVGSKNKSAENAARKQDCPAGAGRNKTYELSKSSSVDRIAEPPKGAAPVDRRAPQPKIKSRSGNAAAKAVSGNNGSALTNLIRRTHSTKLARSTSAIIRSTERHASDGGGSTEASIKSEEADSGQEEAAVFSDENGDSGSSGANRTNANEETDTDAGVHSGKASAYTGNR